MGLSSALATAMSGLRANQASLSIISSNVANAQTPGYVTQASNQIELASGGDGSTVLTTGVNRQLDLFVQGQLRTETSGGGYADQTANILGQLQSVYGTPGGSGTLETTYSNFTSALQALSTSSGNSSAQSVALSAAQSLAQQLNTTTQGIQSLRTNVEQDIGNSANLANAAMTQIAQINTRLQGLSPTDPAAATLMDQRDGALNQLSKLMDIRAITDQSNQTNVFTNAGIQLVGGSLASTINFSSPGVLGATSLYNANPAKSGVGTLNIKLPNGASIDVVANNVISSGQIAADLKLRDQTLVQAQTQVDQLAATLASSLSDKTTAGAAVAGPPSGFDVNLSGALPGNTVNLTYTDTATNTQHQISIVNVTDPAALPLQNAPNANPQAIGVDFSAGAASVAAQLNAALGSNHLQFS
ncbi:MAG: flagellar hook-associated protein FlgK, partial [Bradyrhizobium sp.]